MVWTRELVISMDTVMEDNLSCVTLGNMEEQE